MGHRVLHADWSVSAPQASARESPVFTVHGDLFCPVFFRAASWPFPCAKLPRALWFHNGEMQSLMCGSGLVHASDMTKENTLCRISNWKLTSSDGPFLFIFHSSWEWHPRTGLHVSYGTYKINALLLLLLLLSLSPLNYIKSLMDDKFGNSKSLVTPRSSQIYTSGCWVSIFSSLHGRPGVLQHQLSTYLRHNLAGT